MAQTDREGHGPVLWFDVEDLFHYARSNSRPSGIQRATFEIYRAMQRQDEGAGRIRFVRHAGQGRALVLVSWDEVETLFGRLAEAAAAPAPPAAGASPGRRLLRRMADLLPARLRRPLGLFAVLQVQALRALMQFAATAAGALFQRGTHSLRHVRHWLSFAASSAPPFRPDDRESPFEKHACPGDVLVVLGPLPFHGEYGAVVHRVREELGVRFAILVHDIIPLRRPEWCDQGNARAFGVWLRAVLPQCDTIFANSRATARDLERYAAETGISLRAPVVPVMFGTGFGRASSPASGAPSAGLPAAGTYALFVSTIEARKNHALLLRVWRRMLDELPRDEVPTLVFAGQVGWLVADLMQQLENSNYLEGKIRFIRSPSDADLRALYRGCLFTLFPSLYEGWGLPITESLALGKPCIAANSSSLPEAGGALARYFDPDDVGDAYRVILASLQNREGLAAWEAEVVRSFRPVSWDSTALTILRELRALAPPVVRRLPT